jgi:small GTP-binding protein
MSLTFKIIILGDQFTGKTSLLNRIASNTFYNTYSATIGIDYTNINYTTDNKDYNIILWDTSGQDKFDFLLQSYFKNITGAIIVYDITNLSSFNSVKRRIDEFRDYKKDFDLPILVVSNKIDLEKNRVVQKDALKKLKHMYNVYVLEASVRENINLDKIVQIFIDDIEKKLLDNTLIPCNENGIKIKTSKDAIEFEFEQPLKDNKCCNIL